MSAATHGDSVLATRLARLVSHTRALKASGLIDKDVASEAVNLAAATKSFCDSLDWALARRCVEQIEKVANEVESSDITAVSAALTKHTKAVKERFPKA